MAENKYLVIVDNTITLHCRPHHSDWPPWETDDSSERCCPVYCSHTDISGITPCVHFPFCDKDIFQTEENQTVIRHLREQSFRAEVEGSHKDECPTNATSNCSRISNGTWTEIGTLNRGQASRKKKFLPYFRKTIMLRLECLLVCQFVCQPSSNGIHGPECHWCVLWRRFQWFVFIEFKVRRLYYLTT